MINAVVHQNFYSEFVGGAVGGPISHHPFVYTLYR